MRARQVVAVTGCVRVLARDGLNGQQTRQSGERHFHKAEQQTLPTIGISGEHVEMFEPVPSSHPRATNLQEVPQHITIREHL